jgi:oxygen-independent coproporphyrinogen III oxidase
MKFAAPHTATWHAPEPEYYCYPPLQRLTSRFSTRNYLAWVKRRNAGAMQRPLALSLKMPFFARPEAGTALGSCGRGEAMRYLDHLVREIELQGALFRADNRVERVHCSAGVVAGLSAAQVQMLFRAIRRSFRLAADRVGDYRMVIDPYRTSAKTVSALREIGFNRVQVAIPGMVNGGPRSDESFRKMLALTRSAEFKSVAVLAEYGLPNQTVMQLNRMLNTIIGAGPTQVTLSQHSGQRSTTDSRALSCASKQPALETNADMQRLAAKKLIEAGYVQIGLNAFAKPDDELAVARRQGRLYCDFHGYCAHPGTDRIGLGVAAVGGIGPTYCQNVDALADYYARIEKRQIPIARGYRFSADDLLRRAVIAGLLCHFRLPMAAIEQAYLIVFRDYFAKELRALGALEKEGLVSIGNEWIEVRARGQAAIQRICQVFDTYAGL